MDIINRLSEKNTKYKSLIILEKLINLAKDDIMSTIDDIRKLRAFICAKGINLRTKAILNNDRNSI